MTTRVSVLLSVLAVCWLGTGCGTVNRMQFAVVPPKAPYGMKASLSDADQAKALELVGQTATRLRLENRTAKSMVPNTLALYEQSDSDYPIRLIAWKHDDRILIDFMENSESLGEGPEFRQARDRLLRELRDAFGPQLQVVPLREQVAPSTGSTAP